MRVFVSCQSIDRKPANSLVRGLLSAGVEVAHSPCNPLDGSDERWASWYEDGLRKALDGCDAFVIVVDEGWDSSTWMAIEAETAIGLAARFSIKRILFWNPESVVVKANGMLPYLKIPLPLELEDVVREIASKSE